MDQQQALTVLVQAAQVAQSKGAFSLQEAGVVAQAATALGFGQKRLTIGDTNIQSTQSSPASIVVCDKAKTGVVKANARMLKIPLDR